MTREELKTMFLQMDCSNVPMKKEIIVDLRYLDNEWGPNYGYVEIVRDGPDGYSSSTQGGYGENVLQIVLDRIKLNDGINDLSKYELIIK